MNLAFEIRKLSPTVLGRLSGVSHATVQAYGCTSSGMTPDQIARLSKVVDGVLSGAVECPASTPRSYCTLDEASAILNSYGDAFKARKIFGLTSSVFDSIITGKGGSAYALMKVKCTHLDLQKVGGVPTPAAGLSDETVAHLNDLRAALISAVNAIDKLVS